MVNINDNMSADDINLMVYEAVMAAAEAISNLIDVLESIDGENTVWAEPYRNVMSQLEAQSIASDGGRIDLIGAEIFNKLVTGKDRDTLL